MHLVMIYFAARTDTFSAKRSIRALLVAALFVMLTCALFAQELMDYRGAWQTETPQEDQLVLIIKRNSLASYFHANNTDRTVYQGSWSSDTEGVTLKWKDGSSHRITRSLLGYEITYFDAEQVEQYTTTAAKLPENILGQWAQGPTSPEEELSDRDRAKGFFGIWEIGAPSSPYYLVIEPDRSAATDWSLDSPSEQGLRGSWAKQGSELHIAWDTGHYGILKQDDPDFTFQLIQPGAVIEEAAAETFAATRVGEDQLPSDWQTLYTDERTAQPGGVAFANRKDSVAFYRGPWIVQRTEDNFERIEIGRFGGLKTSTDSTLYGNWRMSGQDIFMNWDDGMRKILSPIGNGFVLYEYKPGRPIDGVPTRIFPATHEDLDRLPEYMEGHKELAEGLLSRAEEAQAAAALLQADSKSLKTNDPWWWPFWSETLPVEAASPEATDAERSSVEVVMEPPAVNREAKISSSKSDWEWPF